MRKGKIKQIKKLFINNLKGVSLVAMLIIIIIIIILTGITVLPFMDNDTINTANETVYKDKLIKYQEIIDSALLDKEVDDILQLKDYSKDYSSWKPGDNIEGTIKELIPDITDNDANNFEVVKGKLVSTGNGTDKEKEWMEEAGIGSRLKIDITVSPDGLELRRETQINITAVPQVGNENVTIKYIWDTNSDLKLVTDEVWESANIYNSMITKTDLNVTKEYLHIYAISSSGQAKGIYVSRPFSCTDIVAPVDSTYTFNTPGWTNEGITVTLNYPDDATVKQYKILPSDVWVDYTAPFEVTENTSILVRSEDISGNENTAVTIVIDKIDKEKPNNAVITVPSTNIAVNSPFNATIVLNDSLSGIDYTRTKYVLNNSATAIGLNESLYTGGILSSLTNNITVTSPSAGGNYYLHVLTVDKAGNMIENISSLIKYVNLHYHVDGNGNIVNSEKSHKRGGCFTRPKYHVHNSGCYRRCGGGIRFRTQDNGPNAQFTNYTVAECDRCGRFQSDFDKTSIVPPNYVSNFMKNGGCTHKELSCGKDGNTIDYYTPRCGYTNGQMIN